MERGFRSLQLLSLMPPKTIPTKFPEMCDRQRSLLRMCIRALATYSKPEYQVVRALQLLEVSIYVFFAIMIIDSELISI